MKNKLLALLIFSMGLTLPAQAEIRASLSRTSIAQNETVQLKLQAVNPPGKADFSVLQDDFSIVNRSFGTSTRRINGHTTNSTTVTLTLAPLSNGNLTVPAIPFGKESSTPLTLSVSPAAGGTSTDPDASFAQPLNGYGSSYQMPPPAWMMPPSQPQPPMWSPPGIGMSDWQPPEDTQGWEAQQETVAEATTPDQSEAFFWPWIALAALIGGIVTSATVCFLRSNRRRPRRAKASAKQEEPNVVQAARPAQPEDLIPLVQAAYASKDSFAAKDALLQWAAAFWPDDPPSNLSRLAARCPEPLQRQILKLDEALYSPDPVEWRDKPVWELLKSDMRFAAEPLNPHPAKTAD